MLYCLEGVMNRLAFGIWKKVGMIAFALTLGDTTVLYLIIPSGSLEEVRVSERDGRAWHGMNIFSM